jgi:hypothetical protein
MDILRLIGLLVVASLFWGIFLNGLRATFFDPNSPRGMPCDLGEWRFWAYGFLTYLGAIVLYTFACVTETPTY